MADMDTINAMAQFIAERFEVEKVILFGSHARGEAGPDSDVDLMVVMRNPKPRGRSAIEILSSLGLNFCVPVDVFVQTPEAIDRYGNRHWSLTYQALSEGKPIYGA